MFSPKTKLGLEQNLPVQDSLNQIQLVKSAAGQPRPANLSPNVIQSVGPAGLNTPGHVQSVKTIVQRTSDISSKVTVQFKRNPQDYFFVDAKVYVVGYKGNPQPVQVASGQSPISFSLENTGEPVSVVVQASGNQGPAPLNSAPNATLQLATTPLATTPTTAGNGTGGAIALTMPAEFSVAGSGTASIVVSKASETKRNYWAAPVDANGAPTFRAMNVLDLPSAIVLGKVRGIVYSPNGNSILNAGLGDQAIQILGTFTYTAPSATEGASGKLTAGAGLGNQASVYHSNIRGVSIGSLKYHYCRAALGSTTLINWWAGVTNVNPGTTLMQTTPTTQNLVMFAWIPSVIPTNFAIVACDGAGTATVASSGVAADLNFHDFLIVFAAGVPTFYIDGVNVGTISTHLPSTSLDCDTVITSQNTGAGASNWFFEHEWWSS
jgi:hypothetical protein